MPIYGGTQVRYAQIVLDGVDIETSYPRGVPFAAGDIVFDQTDEVFYQLGIDSTDHRTPVWRSLAGGSDPYQTTFAGGVVTPGNAPTIAAFYEFPDDTTALVRVNLAIGGTDGATSAIGGLTGSFRRTGGVLVQDGTTQYPFPVTGSAALGAIGAFFDIVGSRINVMVTGIAATELQWRVAGDVLLTS